MATKKSRTCNKPLNNRDAYALPSEGIRMGYLQKITNSTLNDVNLYVRTKSDPPYV